MPLTVVCVSCTRSNEVKEGKWYTDCECGSICLSKVAPGFRYVQLSCKKKEIFARVRETCQTYVCTCCKKIHSIEETLFKRGEEVVFNTTIAKKRVASCNLCKKEYEMKENQWYTHCKNCEDNICLTPIVTGKKYGFLTCESNAVVRANEDTKIYTCTCCKKEHLFGTTLIEKYGHSMFATKQRQIAVCDKCGKSGEVKFDQWNRICKEKECQGNVCLPIAEGIKYIRLDCQEQMVYGRVDETSNSYSCALCNKEHVLEATTIKKGDVEVYNTTVRGNEATKNKEEKSVEKEEEHFLMCDKCSLSYSVPLKQWFIPCETPECERNICLAPVLPGMKYVALNCRRGNVIARVHDIHSSYVCSCCQMQHIVGDTVIELKGEHVIYSSMSAEEFVTLQNEEIQQLKTQLQEMEVAVEKKEEERKEELQRIQEMKEEAVKMADEAVATLEKNSERLEEKAKEIAELKEQLNTYHAVIYESMMAHQTVCDELQKEKINNNELKERSQWNMEFTRSLSLKNDAISQELAEKTKECEEYKKKWEEKCEENSILKDKMKENEKDLLEIRNLNVHLVELNINAMKKMNNMKEEAATMGQGR